MKKSNSTEAVSSSPLVVIILLSLILPLGLVGLILYSPSVNLRHSIQFLAVFQTIVAVLAAFKFFNFDKETSSENKEDNSNISADKENQRGIMNSAYNCLYKVHRMVSHPDKVASPDYAHTALEIIRSLTSKSLYEIEQAAKNDGQTISYKQLGSHRTSFDINRLCHATLEGLTDKLNLTKTVFEFRNTTNFAGVFADQSLLTNILSRLLHDSCNYTQNGKIALDIAASHMLDEIYEIHFTLSDSGIIPSLRPIFDIMRGSEKSTIDLSDSHTAFLFEVTNMIEEMGGQYSIKPNPGQGAQVEFSIIAERYHLNQTPYPALFNFQPKVKASDLIPASILVVEDDEPDQIIAHSFFQKLGYSIHITSSGRDAISLCKDHDFDIVFLDSALPQMPTREIIREIVNCKNSDGQSPRVCVMAPPSDHERGLEELLKAGASAYTPKPINEQKIMQNISTLTH